MSAGHPRIRREGADQGVGAKRASAWSALPPRCEVWWPGLLHPLCTQLDPDKRVGGGTGAGMSNWTSAAMLLLMSYVITIFIARAISCRHEATLK